MKLEARYHRILEARDRSPICVASIRDFKNGRLLVHFDGWTADYDYWYDSDSIDLHPMGWCKEHGMSLQPPKGICGGLGAATISGP